MLYALPDDLTACLREHIAGQWRPAKQQLSPTAIMSVHKVRNLEDVKLRLPVCGAENVKFVAMDVFLAKHACGYDCHVRNLRSKEIHHERKKTNQATVPCLPTPLILILI